MMTVMMLVVVVTTAIGVVTFVVVMPVMVFVVVVTTAVGVVTFVVVMSVMVFVVSVVFVTTTIGVVTFVVVMPVMMFVVVFHFFCQRIHFCLQRIFAFHRQENGFPVQTIPRRSDKGCRVVFLFQKRNGGCKLFFGYFVGMRKDNTACIFHLVAEKLAEIL